MKNPGKYGEDLAVKFLQDQGYKILARNFRSHFGEIDIIGLDGGILVFIEVKTRWNEAFGLPEEAITPRKIRSIARTGDYYKLLNPQLPGSLRIDAVVIEIDEQKLKRIELIKNLTL